jgi:hypothetical protein
MRSAKPGPNGFKNFEGLSVQPRNGLNEGNRGGFAVNRLTCVGCLEGY